MSDFKQVETIRYWCQKVLPLVYDDSLSYYELLNKVVKKLNDLITNNEQLPEYISNLIQQYISSGAIGEVVQNILTGFMLNVKNPPNGLKPAVGDGTEDDTQAFQGCIDYANSIGGGCVYIPNGVYLTQPLVLYDNVSLFGFDRYSARLVLKGGATKAMFTGNVTNTSLTGLTIDGNMDIQVNNINLIDINAEELILQNLVLTDGYVLVKANVNKSTQISNVVCDYSVVRHMELSGSGLVLGSNLYLHDISKLKGTNLVTLNNNNSVLSNIVSNGETPVGFIINGNNNSVSGTFDNAVIPFKDNGTNNTIINNGKTEQLKITGDRVNNVGGNETNNVARKYEINAENINLNTTQPLEYKEPVELNDYFKTIPFKDKNGNNYSVIVQGVKSIMDLEETVVNEITDRTQADILLNEKITKEILDRTEADNLLETKISEEVLSRTQADQLLNEKITEETNARILADGMLEAKIEAIKPLGIVNVKDYGAKGDGITDDYEAITLAISTVNSNGGGVIFFPNGEYLISKTIVFGLCTNVIGENTYTSVIKLSNNFTSLYEGGVVFRNNQGAGHCDHVSMKNMTINANKQPVHAFLGFSIYDDVILENVTIKWLDGTHNGFRLVQHEGVSDMVSQGIIMMNCLVYAGTTDATGSLYYFNGVQEMQLIGCKGFAGHGGFGELIISASTSFEMIDCRGIVLLGCSLGANRASIYPIIIKSVARHSAGFVISGTTFESTEKLLYIKGTESFPIDSVTFTGSRNEGSGGTQPQIYLEHVRASTIECIVGSVEEHNVSQCRIYTPQTFQIAGGVAKFYSGGQQVLSLDYPWAFGTGLYLLINDGSSVSLKQVNIGEANSAGEGNRILMVTN